MTSEARRIAVIGGGLSGLSSAIALARNGVHVDLFEARDTLGGCCASTIVDGYRFNDGAMFLAMPQLLDRAYTRLGLERAELLPLRRIDVPQASVLDSGSSVVLGPGQAVRVHGSDGIARTATMQAQLADFLERWRPLLHIFGDELLTEPLSLPRTLARLWRYLPRLRGTLADELRRSFRDDDARAALAAVTLYTGLAPERTPVFQAMALVSMFEDGLQLPEHGMEAIPNGLEQVARALGVRIHAGATVQRIVLGQGRVRALRVDGGEHAFDVVVSTVGGMNTFDGLLDPQDVPAAMKRKVARAPLSHRALAVQLGLRNRLLPPAFCMNHVPAMELQHRLHGGTDGGRGWLSYTVPTTVLPQLAPAGGSVVEMYVGVDPDRPLDSWDAQATQAVADAAVERLARHQPLDMAVRRVVTPMDHARRMHLYRGALYGLSPAATPTLQFPHRTPVHGLYLAGQTTYPGFGVATSLFSGIFAAEALLQHR
jgi:phytoene desaturase